MTPTVQSELLSSVDEHLSLQMGMRFGEMRFGDLERGLSNAAAELALSNTESCIKALLAGTLTKTQLQILAQNLTIGETYFFRDPAVFVALEEKIIPALVMRKRKEKKLRLWSAGCSSGEEAYSLAISLHRVIRDIENWQISLLASDINAKSLEKGRRAAYGSWSFRSTPEEFLPLYFVENEDGSRSPREEIRKMVKFDYLNLADDIYPGIAKQTSDLDILFCRNVLIYFTKEKTEEIALKLSNCLSPGGTLVTSATDSSRLLGSAPGGLSRTCTTMFKKL